MSSKGDGPAVELTDEQRWAEIDPWGQTNRLDHVDWHGRELLVGQRVTLRPSGGADIFDIALSGRIALIDSFEQDFEDQVHVAVVLEDDPGADLGHMRQPGHRFFFKLDEIEPCDAEAVQ